MLKKHMTGSVYFTGSKITKSRTIYTDGSKYYVKHGENYIEVVNSAGLNNVTSGWKTVLEY